MDYKIRVNRPCRLFIDGEEIQVLNELQLTKIDLAPGEYLRKVVAIDNPSIFDETVLSISSSKVDLITLDITGLEVARRNALPEGEFFVGNFWYAANEDKISVSVSKYNKDLPPKELIVPDTINYAGYNYSVASIGERAFYECSSLTSIAIPNSVTSIGDGAFCGCSSLTSIAIPNSITSIGDGAFCGCSSLTSIAIPNSVTSIGEIAFWDCKLSSVVLTASSEEDFCKGQGNSLLYSAEVCCHREIQINGSKVIDFTIPNSVTSIGERAFYECSSLTSVAIPNSVTSIGDDAFRGCSRLTSVTIPNSVTSIGDGAFEGSGVYNDNANWENDVLYINDSLIRVKQSVSGAYIIKEDTRLIGGGAFKNCKSLTSVAIPNGVTSIGRCAFSDCSSLTSITIPNSITRIGSSAFSGCSSLTSIAIPNSVTSIGRCAFFDCSSLTSITIGNSVISIGFWAFFDCSSLTSVTIGNSVTSIGFQAFCDCKSLTSITIPNSVTSIGYCAFDGCKSLTSAKYTGTKEQWNKIELRNFWAKESGIEVIHCTDGEIRL